MPSPPPCLSTFKDPLHPFFVDKIQFLGTPSLVRMWIMQRGSGYTYCIMAKVSVSVFDTEQNLSNLIEESLV